MECDVMLARPEGHESLSVVIPWSDRRFQCTTKDNTRPATGSVRWDGREWTFDGPGHAYGCLDFGRGKWQYRTVWNWTLRTVKHLSVWLRLVFTTPGSWAFPGRATGLFRS